MLEYTELFRSKTGNMGRYIRTKKLNKSNVSASWKKGYADAASFAKKYPKAMKELG